MKTNKTSDMGHNTVNLPSNMDKAKRKVLCIRCGLTLQRGHRCSYLNVRKHIRERIDKGDVNVHIAAGLLNGMEEIMDREDTSESQQREKQLSFAICSSLMNLWDRMI